MSMLKKIAAVLIFAIFLFIAIKCYNYMSTDGFNDAGPITGFGCPNGWQQEPTDNSNGKCIAPCTPGNNNPQSFAYGPNTGGFPLNRRSGWDYCNDTNNGSDQSQAFSAKSATVGPTQMSETPAPAVQAQVSETPAAAVQAPVTAPTMTPDAGIPYTCPDGFSQVKTNPTSGTCSAPCPPANNNPKSFAYGPSSGGYPVSRRTGKSYCAASKITNMRGEFIKRTPTVQQYKEGFESLSTLGNIEGVTVKNIPMIKDVATNAAEVMTDKLEANTVGLNVTCASGDKPKISYIRNSKFATSSKDINTLKGVRGRKQDFSCSEPTQNQYIFNPFTET